MDLIMGRPDLPVALTERCASDSSSLASGAGVAAPVIPRSCFASVGLAGVCDLVGDSSSLTRSMTSCGENDQCISCFVPFALVNGCASGALRSSSLTRSSTSCKEIISTSQAAVALGTGARNAEQWQAQGMWTGLRDNKRVVRAE
jgi:hypothetical protein